MSEIVFTRTDAELGEFAVRPVDVQADTGLLHTWLTHPKSVFWMLQDATVADVRHQFATIAATEGHDAFLGLHNGRPAFLVERYDPAGTEVARVYDVQPGDVGMHFLAAPTATPMHGFTCAVLVTMMDLLFADEATARVVVEPDVRNHAVHALNAAVGFDVVDTVPLTGKDVYLSTCTRVQYDAARPAATEGARR